MGVTYQFRDNLQMYKYRAQYTNYIGLSYFRAIFRILYYFKVAKDGWWRHLLKKALRMTRMGKNVFEDTTQLSWVNNFHWYIVCIPSYYCQLCEKAAMRLMTPSRKKGLARHQVGKNVFLGHILIKDRFILHSVKYFPRKPIIKTFIANSVRGSIDPQFSLSSKIPLQVGLTNWQDGVCPFLVSNKVIIKSNKFDFSYRCGYMPDD